MNKKNYALRFFPIALLLIFCDCTVAQNQLTAKKPSGKEAIEMSNKLMHGWNTWNTRSVLSHVLLPECFSINLALKDQQGKILEETLIGRDHYDSKEQVIAGPHAYDGTYTELEVEWHNIRVRVQSASVNNELYILVSPLKAATGDSLLITPKMLWNRKGEVKIDQRMIVGQTPTNNINVYVNGNKKIISSNAFHIPLDKKIAISSGMSKPVELVENMIKKAKLTFESERFKADKTPETYDAMQTVLAWTTIYDPNNSRIINPVSRTFSNDWVLFGWDTYFAAYMLSLDNKELAYANAIAITKEITAKGFVPNNSQYGNKSEDRTEPQVGSIVVREIYRKYKEKWFLQEVYNELLSWNRWRAANRDIDGYLVHGTDPYDLGGNKSRSATESGKMKAAKWESGMDNSPMWDDASFDSVNHRMLMADVGLMSLYIADCQSLSEIAAILGNASDAKELTERANKYSKKLETLWDDQFGLYLNKDLVTGKPSYRLTPTLFYPLLTKVPSLEQASRMMKEHFYNPNEFWGEYILPSVARNDKAFKDNHYWRGRIWAPLNFLVYLGMRNYDIPDAKKDLVEKSKALLLKTWLSDRHVCENYHAETGLGGEANTWSDAFYHWGALLGFMDIMEKGYVPSPQAVGQVENIDQAVMAKIRKEGLVNSKVMDIAFQITDASGPRVTNSPGFMRAANYAKNQLTPWVQFGKGWELEKSYVAMSSPWYRSLIAYPKTWTSGTNGLQKGEVILISAKDSVELEAYRNKLKGNILIFDDLMTYDHSNRPAILRRSDEDLKKLGEAVESEDTAALRRRTERNKTQNVMPRGVLNALKRMAVKEGATAILSSSADNHSGTVFVLQGGPYKITDPANFLDIAIGLEDYNTIVRLLRNKIPVKMDVDVKTRFQTNDTQGYNVIAEIPGIDKDLKEEVVMLGAHLDSWPAATGATDNAAGVCVMMEAIRILKAIGVQPRRTIRIALWSGEEQGLLGSRGYVKKTFGDAETMKLLPAHDKLSAYYNLDYGTGKVLGIHLQGNEAARNIFQQWFAPFNDLRAKTVTIQNTGSTDHISFNTVGLPGFQFIQDRLVTQHSNMDSYDHLMPDDLKQSATIVAAFVYNTAMRNQKIPRKELPKLRSVDPVTGFKQ
ncbi:MAG: hypothetical protein RLZZ05_1426 [Bacteroidota bacterium]